MGGRLKLGQILIRRGLLHPDQLSAALADQQASGARLGATLVRMGFVDEVTLVRTLAGQLELPVARIRGKRVTPEVLDCIPAELAEKHRCLPLFFKQEGEERALYVAMEDPSDAEALAELERAAGQRLRAVLVAPTELEEALQRHYHWVSLTGESPDRSAARAPVAPAADAPGPPPPPPSAAPWPEDPRDAETEPELPGPGPAPAPPPPRPPRPDSLDPAIILRALSQLLVEKGVLTRDEFVQRLGEIAARQGGE